MNTIWLTLAETVLVELEQSADEGRDVRPFAEKARAIFDASREGRVNEEDAKALLDRIRNAPIAKDFPYYEPASLDEIRKARPKTGRPAKSAKPEGEILYDKIYGAWLGRASGCLLGQPVEGWYSGRITGFLKDTDNYPVKYYMSSDVGKTLRKKYNSLLT